MKKENNSKKLYLFALTITPLIVIIALILFLCFASNLISVTPDSSCVSSIDKEMTKLKTNLEETVSRKTNTSFTFSPLDDCYSASNKIMKIDLVKDAELCRVKCNYPSENCYILTHFDSSKPFGYTDNCLGCNFLSNLVCQFHPFEPKQKCLDLPPLTTFLTQNCPIDGNYIGYTLIDPTNPDNNLIGKGKYIFINISTAEETYPKVCVYYKPLN